MPNYFKIYHYSAVNELKKIDPGFFGTGVCAAALKHGALGINKSYYFVSQTVQLPNPTDRPVKYEVYLPCEWKIYDMDRDPEKLYQQVRAELAAEKLHCYDWLVAERLETRLVKSGYHGRTHVAGVALALFYPLSTLKPEGSGYVFDYLSGKLIEELIPKQHASAFFTPNSDSVTASMESVIDTPRFR